MLLAERLIDIIAPVACLGCGREGRPLCSGCASQASIARPACPRCHKLNAQGQTCRKCHELTALAGVTTAARYQGVVRDLVTSLKYEHATTAATALADLLAPAVDSSQFDLITWIPGAPSRYRRRGYHQAELIARQLARRIGLPATALLARLQTSSQVGLGRAERLHQVRGTFAARARRTVRDQRVLIVDDVLTTGATLGEAASVLKAAGATSVWAAVAARD